MEYRKERNFIVAYEGEKMCGKWNILTNQYIGIKGGVLKGFSPAFSMSHIYTMSNRVFQYALEAVRANAPRRNFTPEHGKRLEEIISLNLFVSGDNRTWDMLAHDTVKLDKDFIKFMEDHNTKIYGEHIVSQYRTYKAYASLLDAITNEDDKTWALDVADSVRKDIPFDFVKTMVARAIHEKVPNYHTAYQMKFRIEEWYDMQIKMNEKPTPLHNFLTQFNLLQWRYKEYMKENYDTVLQLVNDKPWLHFETDEFIIRPLISKADFHNEALYQHNCVEYMYMEQVCNGYTHVVCVRKKSEPDKPFITCEVGNDGLIRQYLYAYNRHVSRDSDEGRLKIQYQLHIDNNK